MIGPRTLEQLDDYLAALHVDLSVAGSVAGTGLRVVQKGRCRWSTGGAGERPTGQAERLDRVSAVAPGVPHQVAADGRAALLGGDADAFRPLAIPVA